MTTYSISVLLIYGKHVLFTKSIRCTSQLTSKA
uniref:Uncharacterized protein n=1 Tax=Arundo donax TaxID=35708 RepID=A0A0A8Z4L0_ARUDO